MILRRGSRTRAATAAFLSSLFPGAGQLYNGDWVKAVFMMVLTAALLLAMRAGLASVASVAAASVPTFAGLEEPTSATPWPQLIPALAEPAVQARARRHLLPPIFGLCGVLLWSMGDAYRRARSELQAPLVRLPGAGAGSRKDGGLWPPAPSALPRRTGR